MRRWLVKVKQFHQTYWWCGHSTITSAKRDWSPFFPIGWILGNFHLPRTAAEAEATIGQWKDICLDQLRNNYNHLWNLSCHHHLSVYKTISAHWSTSLRKVCACTSWSRLPVWSLDSFLGYYAINSNLYCKFLLKQKW